MDKEIIKGSINAMLEDKNIKTILKYSLYWYYMLNL